MRRLVFGLVSGVFVVVFTSTSAFATDFNTDDNGAGGTDQEWDQNQQGPSGPGSENPYEDAAASADPQPWTQYKYEPRAPITANTNGQGIDIVTGCDNPKAQFVDAYSRVIGADGKPQTDWLYLGPQCLPPGTPMGPQEPQITADMVLDEAWKFAPETEVHLQPSEGWTLVNAPTNYYAETEQVTKPIDLLGQTIEITFIPAAYKWEFGDGSTGSGPGIESADIGQAGAVEHAYARSGEYDVTLGRVFTVRFTLPDGETVTVRGEVSNTSDPESVEARESQAVVTEVD